jgi:chaperonin GroES
MKKPKNKKKPAVKAKKTVSKVSAVKNSIGVTPVGDRVLIRRKEAETTTSFGIIIPDTTKEKSEEGIIVAVGAGKKNSEGKVIPVSLEVGQHVRFSYGEEMKIKGVDYVLVHEESVVAILN